MKNVLAEKWQQTGKRSFRNKIPKLSGDLRKNLIHKLKKFSKFEEKDGKTHFLLFRGSLHKIREYREITSWTPDFGVAERFAQDYTEKYNKNAYVEEAWFSEDQIHSIIFFFKSEDENSNLWNDEFEVLISPTIFQS